MVQIVLKAPLDRYHDNDKKRMEKETSRLCDRSIKANLTVLFKLVNNINIRHLCRLHGKSFICVPSVPDKPIRMEIFSKTLACSTIWIFQQTKKIQVPECSRLQSLLTAMRVIIRFEMYY